MKRFLILVLVGLVGLVNLAQELGTRENPIIWVFPPSTQPALIEEVAKKIAADIGRMTGLFIVPKVMPDYAALIEAFKAAEGNVMGVPTTDQYARISVETNFETTPRLAAVRYGYPYYFSSVYAPREKGFATAQDLNGTVWIYNDEGSTSGFKLPKMLFDKEGITFKGVVKSGGHTAAGGFTVPTAQLPELEARLAAFAERTLTEEDLRPRLELDAELALQEVTWDLWRALAPLEPFSPANPRPLFWLRDVRIRRVRPVGDGSHLQLLLEGNGGHRVEAIAFRQGEHAAALEAVPWADLAVHLSVDRWNGQERLRLQVAALRPRGRRFF